MDLCTVTNAKYVTHCLNLINSYRLNSYNKKVFVYLFDVEKEQINNFAPYFGPGVVFKQVPKTCDHAHHPTAFYYKTYALKDCLPQTSGMIYSDATNAFNKKYDIESDLVDDALFLPYNHPGLTNHLWTTDKCFKKMECETAKYMMQYWAGFQAYKNTKQNVDFLNEMERLMMDPDLALPDTSVKQPDGPDSPCKEHRQDQSVYSLLIHKKNRHTFYNPLLQSRYGDWQTYKVFDPNYVHDHNNMVLSPRESKFGNMRFLQ